MSHSVGMLVDFKGNVFLFEYDGTSDICGTRLYFKDEELRENWRKDYNKECKCIPKKYDPCMLFTIYGCLDKEWDFLFYSQYCISCLAITGVIVGDR